MEHLEFQTNSEPTVGIELELGLVDNKTMALKSAGEQLLSALPPEMQKSLKPELMQCVIEINTDVCNTIDEAQKDLASKAVLVEQAADKVDVRLWWGGSHPFSSWRDQQVTQNERYLDLVNLLQEMARRLVTFGLHVHVGVASGDKAVMICDRMMRHLPTLLALSCSSPYWDQNNTGLQSIRTKIMEGLPTAGLPPVMRNWSEYLWLVRHMVETGFINTVRELWWDIRPHHKFGTVEVRVCDMPGNLEDSLGLAALIQCLVTALSDQIDRGTYQLDCHPMLVRQNKWRACRYGGKAKLVDSFTYKSQSVSFSVNELVEHLIPTAKRLDCLDHLEHTRLMASRPTWADRQLSLMDSSNDRVDVVRELTDESRISTPSV